MSFDIKIEGETTKKTIQLIDAHSETAITIFCKGGLMNQWSVKDGLSSFELVNGNKETINFELDGFRSGKMSPFSCRIAEGKYLWNNQLYQFNKFYLGKHAMHGLVYDANFSIAASEVCTEYAKVILLYKYEGADIGFPFPYEISIDWTLYRNNLISVKTTITNKSKNSIPMMDGWHPYFSLGGKVDDYHIEFHNDGKIEMREDMIPTGTILKENTFDKGNRIGTTHFDDCYLLDPIHNSIMLSYQDKIIEVCPKHNYPYLQIYTPGDRQSIAIENLSGAPNCFNNKMGLHKLEPQDQIYFETTYQFRIVSPL